jgi:hypothetical protein
MRQEETGNRGTVMSAIFQQRWGVQGKISRCGDWDLRVSVVRSTCWIQDTNNSRGCPSCPSRDMLAVQSFATYYASTGTRRACRACRA